MKISTQHSVFVMRLNRAMYLAETESGVRAAVAVCKQPGLLSELLFLKDSQSLCTAWSPGKPGKPGGLM